MAYIQLSYNLVFVTELQEGRAAEVLAILEEENIVPAAMYRIQTGESWGKWGLDYSQIYTDLHISAAKVAQSCLIVAPMTADYSELGKLIEGRTMPRCHCSRLPVPTLEHPKVPVTVLMSHLLLRDSGSSSSTLLSLIISEISPRFDQCSKRIAFDWLDRQDSFPYKRLWMRHFSAKDQISSRALDSAAEACSLLLVKTLHVKANFEVGFRRCRLPER